MNLTCPHCGAAATGANSNCTYCGGAVRSGSPHTASCPECGEVVSLDADRCSHCGALGPFYPADKDWALLRAIRNGDLLKVLVLLKLGAKVNGNQSIEDPDGAFTPLDAAESFGQTEIADVIRRHGGKRANPNQPLSPIPPEMRHMINSLVRAAVRGMRGG